MARTQRLFCTTSHHLLGMGKGSLPCQVAWQREFLAVVRGFRKGWAIACESFLSFLVHLIISIDTVTVHCFNLFLFPEQIGNIFDLTIC